MSMKPEITPPLCLGEAWLSWEAALLTKLQKGIAEAWIPLITHPRLRLSIYHFKVVIVFTPTSEAFSQTKRTG